MAFTLDAKTISCGYTQSSGGYRIATYELKPGETHAQELVPFIEKVLGEAALTPHVILTTRGPGRFTNVRIVLATAFGFSQGYGASRVTPTCFEVVSCEYPHAYVAIMSGRGDYFCKDLATGKESVNDAADLNTDQSRELVTDDSTIPHKLLIDSKWLCERLLMYANKFSRDDVNEAHYAKIPQFKTVEDQKKGRESASKTSV